MASLLRKIVSGLDFWDKEENKAQREQFAREEEERKKKALQAAVSVRPATPAQSFMPPERVTDPQMIPMLQKVTPPDTRGETQKKLDLLAEANRKAAEKQATQGQNWLERSVLNRGSNKRNAEIIARGRATRDFQEANGYNRDSDVLDYSAATLKKAKSNTGTGSSPLVAPILSLGRVGTGIAQGAAGLYDLATPGEGQNRLTKSTTKKAEEIDKLAKDMDLNAPYKVGNVVGEVASYFLPTALTKAGKVGGAVAEVGAKGSKAVGTGSKAARFAGEAVEEFFDPKNIEMEARLTGRYLGQDSAQGEDISGRVVAENVAQSVAGAFLPAGLRRALSKLGGSKLEEDAVIAGTAGTASKVIDEAGKLDINGETSVIDNVKAPDDVNVPISPDEVAPGVESANPTRDADIAAVEAEKAAEEAARAEQAAAQAEAAAPKPEPIRTVNAAVDAATLASESGRAPGTAAIDTQTLLNTPEAIRADAQKQMQLYRAQNPGVDPAELQRVQDGIDAITEYKLSQLDEAAQTEVSAVTTPQELPPATPVAPAVSAGVADNAVPVDASTPVAAAEVEGGPTITEEVPATPELAAEGQAVAPGEEIPVQTEDGTPATDRTAEDAPRIRKKLNKQLGAVAKELENNPQTHKVFSNEELRAASDRVISTLSDDEILAAYSGGFTPKNLAEIAQANSATTRLSAMAQNADPESTELARQAIDNIIDETAKFESQSGRGLQYAQGLFEGLPAEAKASYLIRSIDKARAGAPEGKFPLIKDDVKFKTEVQDKIVDFLKKTEGKQSDVVALEAKVQAIMDKAEASQITKTDIRDMAKLGADLDRARLEIQKSNGDLLKYYDTLVPNASIDSRAGDLSRTLMLTSPIGRVNDVVTTTISAMHTLAQMTGESLLGKAGNLLSGKPGKYIDAFPSPSALKRGAASGGRKSGAEFSGNILAGDLQKSIRNKASGGKAQMLRAAGNGPGARLKRFVRAGSELATDVTQGIKSAEINRLARQEGKQMGLKGDALKAWAMGRESLPTPLMENRGTQLHEAVNNLNDNPITKVLDGVSKPLVQIPYFGEQVKNLVMPFTKWAGGNAWNAVTDKNAVAQFGKLVNAARKGDGQAVAKAASGLAVNAGAAMTLGYKLAEAGILTDEDAEGYKDGGVYIKAGDRYIPATFLGFFAPSMIMGKATYDAFQRPDTNVVEDIWETGIQTAHKMWDAYSRNTIPGQNNSTLNTIGREGFGEESFSTVGGRVAGNYIPAATSDINAVLNQTSLNPTKEAALTKAEKESPESGEMVKDYPKTAWNQLLNRIPVLSQKLPRKEGVAADDVIDRLTHGNRDTATSKQNRADEAVVADQKKRGVPDTDAAIEASWQNGDYDLANEGIRAKMAKAEKKGELSKTDKDRLEYEIRRNDTLKNKKISYDDFKQYEKVGVEQWRKYGDPDDPEFDEKLYQKLWALDQAFLENKATDSSKGHDAAKYYLLAKKGGSGGGGGGGSKIDGPGSIIALQKADLGDLKYRGSSTGQIPRIAKIKPNQLVKKRTISVRKGR